MTEFFSPDLTVSLNPRQSPSLDCAVPRSGLHCPSYWIPHACAVDSRVPVLDFGVFLSGFQNSPQWFLQSPSVNCTVPDHSRLRSPTPTCPSSVEDCPVSLSGFYRPDRKNSGRHIVVGFRIPSGLCIVYYCFKT